MKYSFLSLLLLVVLAAQAQPADYSLYRKQWLIQDGDTLPYRVLLPEQYDSSRAYPLVVFLHGRGESGLDNEKQLVHGARLFLADSFRRQYPAIVVFPQCPPDNYWSNVQAVTQEHKNGKREFYFRKGGEPTRAMRLLMGLTENLQVRFKTDTKRIYVMGLSMGGMGTFELVRRMPGVFAAAVPICGGAHPDTAPALKGTAWWIFHGLKDEVVLPVYSQQMASALQTAGARIRLTLYPDANHNSWDPAFREAGLMKWLFSQRRK